MEAERRFEFVLGLSGANSYLTSWNGNGRNYYRNKSMKESMSDVTRE
jgi:hypothetical protein